MELFFPNPVRKFAYIAEVQKACRGGVYAHETG